MALTTHRSLTRWLVVTLLIGAAAACWEIGADAGRIRVAARFLAGQTVSLASASASDSYALLASLAVMFAVGAMLIVFVRWVRRAPRKPVLPTVVVVWWVLWLLANIVGRVVELTYRATSSLTDIRNVTLIDGGECVLLIASALVMVVAVRRAETRRQQVPVPSQPAAVRSKRTPAVKKPEEPEQEHPAAATHRAARGVAITVAGVALIVGPLALAFAVSNGTTSVPHPAATSAPQSAAWQASNAAATTCSDAMFQPNATIAAGASSACANLTLGKSLFIADCTKGGVPAVLSPEIFDNTGQSSTLGTVQSASGACALTTKSTSVTTALLAGDAQGPTNEPGSVVVVADFIPADNPSGLNTIGVRVSSTAELDVAIESDGGYAVIESTGGATPQALLQGNFSSTNAKAPNLAREIRVVVSVEGSTAAAYIDGLRLGIGPTSVPNTPGGCGFSLSTNDASTPVVAKLLHLEIFATA